MNGAQSLIATLKNNGIEVCFTNPGTSEMTTVAAIDHDKHLRSILVLFEGVATGAADGYARMLDKPAATLLHLGAGLGNGLANLHNAKRANVPLLNIVGDQATYHVKSDSPLTSDITSVAQSFSAWTGTTQSANAIVTDTVSAIQSAIEYPGQIATLILPADTTWSELNDYKPMTAIKAPPKPVETRVIAEVEEILRKHGEHCALILGGHALREEALALAGRISEATGAKLFIETFPTRLQRGAGRVNAERIPYFPEIAAEALQHFKHVILVGTKEPVAFFAYPGKPTALLPKTCQTTVLSSIHAEMVTPLSLLAGYLGAPQDSSFLQTKIKHEIPTGALTISAISACITNLLPENAIISDEGITATFELFPLTATAAAHDWLSITGGAIGQGIPVATGAAVACPARKVVCLSGDGSAMYTVQALWTQARENLDVTTVIFANHSYKILNIEHERMGAGTPGPKGQAMLSLTNPTLNWVDIASGMGVPATRAHTVAEFFQQFSACMQTPGPHLIEAELLPLVCSM